MNVLVTGGSGYFGSLLVEKLITKGHNVGVLDINKPHRSSNKLRFHQCDIRDINSLERHLNGYDIVFHNVAQVPIAKDKDLFKEVNIDGTKNICKACSSNNISKLIHTSSSAIYGIPDKNPVDENSIPTPMEDYGRAKLEAENICREYSSKNLKISILRPRTILGHGRLGIFSLLFSWVEAGVNIPVLNNGNNIYQFVHAEDLANACILASQKEHQFECYNIGASDYGTMRKTLEDLCKYAGTGSRVYSLPLKPIEIVMNITSKLGLTPLGPYHSLMYGRSLYFDTKKATKELGFKPKYSTKEMFIQSYNWYINNASKIEGGSDLSNHKKPLNESLLKILRWIP